MSTDVKINKTPRRFSKRNINTRNEKKDGYKTIVIKDFKQVAKSTSLRPCSIDKK